jgi:hypothetical protein
MKKITSLVAITSLFITQLFALQIANATQKNYQIEIAPHSPSIKFSRLKVQNENQQLVLSGRLKRRSPNTHVFPGHLDVVVKGNDNQAILHKTISYSPNRLHKRSVFGSEFKLVLPENLPKGSAIKVKWHRNQSVEHMVSSVLSIQKLIKPKMLS